MQADVLSPLKKKEIRGIIIAKAKDQVGKPYKFGIEIKMEDPNPGLWDCSELIEWCYYQAGLSIPDGSANQFEFTIPTANPLPGDLFFGCNDDGKIVHVGILYDEKIVIEARGDAKYMRVVERPRETWEKWKHFKGFRQHPKLV